MHYLFGKIEGHKCKECSRLICVPGLNGKRFYKCLNYGQSNAESTDWRLSYTACGLLNKEIEKTAVNLRVTEPKQQITGQTSFLEKIAVEGKMKYYNRTKEECVKLRCKCVDCLSNHHNEKYCCWNCGTCSSENCGGITKYDH